MSSGRRAFGDRTGGYHRSQGSIPAAKKGAIGRTVTGMLAYVFGIGLIEVFLRGVLTNGRGELLEGGDAEPRHVDGICGLLG